MHTGSVWMSSERSQATSDFSSPLLTLGPACLRLKKHLPTVLTSGTSPGGLVPFPWSHVYIPIVWSHSRDPMFRSNCDVSFPWSQVFIPSFHVGGCCLVYWGKDNQLLSFVSLLARTIASSFFSTFTERVNNYVFLAFIDLSLSSISTKCTRSR